MRAIRTLNFANRFAITVSFPAAAHQAQNLRDELKNFIRSFMSVTLELRAKLTIRRARPASGARRRRLFQLG